MLAPILPDGLGGTSLRELANKLGAFGGFTAAGFSDRCDGRDQGVQDQGVQGDRGDQGLVAAIHRDLAGDPYAAMWAIEGRAHHRGRSLPKIPAAKLREVAARLPLAALVPYHSGLGLAAAARCLAEAEQAGPSTALFNFRESCARQSSSGYEGIVFEALGLTVRTLRPHLLRALDRELASAPELASLFWHGVGRGIYLAPSNAPPCTLAARRAVAEIAGGPHGLAAANAAAGVAFAGTLVNVRHPRVTETLLASWRGRLPAASLDQGVAAALRVWGRMGAPRDEFAARFAAVGDKLAGREAIEGAAALFRCVAGGMEL